MTITIALVPHDSEPYWRVVDLRRLVLRAPLGRDYTADELRAEAADSHLAAYEGGRAVGSIILSPPDAEGHAHIRQMAVVPEGQGRGIGAALVRAAETLALANGWTEIALASRETAIGFYEKLGYAAEGESYLRVSLPHRRMRKTLKT